MLVNPQTPTSVLDAPPEPVAEKPFQWIEVPHPDGSRVKFKVTDPKQIKAFTEKFYADRARKHKNEWLTIAGGIQTGPAPQSTMGRLKRAVSDPQLQGYDDKNVLAKQAIEDGFDVDTGIPRGKRAAYGLANLKHDGLKAEALKKLVAEEWAENGIKIPHGYENYLVVKDENTNRVAYLRPVKSDTKEGEIEPQKFRYTLVDPVGLDVGDWAEFTREFPPMAAQVAATTIAAAVTGTPSGAVALSSMLNGAIEALDSKIRDRLLKERFGFTDEEIAESSDPNEALTRAIWAVGGEYAAFGMIEGVRRWKNRGYKKWLNDEEEWASITDALEEGPKAIDDMSRALGREVRPSEVAKAQAAGQAAGGEAGARYIMEAETALKDSPDWLFKQQAAVDLANQLNVARGVQEMTGDAARRGVPQSTIARADLPDKRGMIANRERPVSIAQRVTNRLRGNVDDPQTLAQLKAHSQRAQENLDDQLAAIASPEAPNWTAIREQTAEKLAAWQTYTKDIWNKFDDIVLRNNAVLDNSTGTNKIKQTFRRLEAQANRMFSKSSKDRSLKVLDDLSALKDSPTLNSGEIQKQISILGREIGQAKLGRHPDGWKVDDLVALQDALEFRLLNGKWLNSATGAEIPKVAKAAGKFFVQGKEATLYLNRIARQSEVQNLVAKVPVNPIDAKKGATTRYAIRDASVRDALMESRDLLATTLEVTRRDPTLMQAMAGTLEKDYVSKVFPKGEFKQAAYDRWWKTYGDHAKQIFGENAANKRNFKTPRAMGQAVEDLSQRYQSALRYFKETYGKLLPAEGMGITDNIVDTMFTSNTANATQIRNIMKVIRRADPKLALEIRAQTAQMIQDEMFNGAVLKGGDNVFTNLVRKRGDRLRAIFDHKYVNDLETIEKGLRYLDVAGFGAVHKTPGQRMWLRLARSMFGPLSKKQRMATALNQIYKDHSAKKALEIVGDPEQLRRYILLQKMTPGTAAWSASITSLGLQTLMEMENDLIEKGEMPGTKYVIPSELVWGETNAAKR